MLTRKIQQQGFNLIELMIVLAIAAILIGIGLPSLKTTIDRKAVTAEATRFARSINFARSQAITQSQVVTLERKSPDANDWSQGWIIYIDEDGAGNQTFDDGDESNNEDGDTLLRDVSISSQGLDIKTDNTGNKWISFAPSGRLHEGGASTAITICDQDRSLAFAGSRVDVSPVGRTRISAIEGPNKTTGCL
ncbi:MAG: GspH/FimT family pseudopilin [Spongiibacteraceae bacterium]